MGGMEGMGRGRGDGGRERGNGRGKGEGEWEGGWEGWVGRQDNQALSKAQVLPANSPHSASCIAVLTSKYLQKKRQRSCLPYKGIAVIGSL